MSRTIDYDRYTTLNITRRGPVHNGIASVLDIQMRARNGKLPTAAHDGHWELSEIWRDVGADDTVRAVDPKHLNEWVTIESQVPVWETSCPAKKSLKLRWRRERKVSEAAALSLSVMASVLGVSWAGR